MKATDFITQPAVMSMYKNGEKEKALKYVTSVAGYQIAKTEIENGEATVVNEVTPDETPVEETVIDTPTVNEVTPDETPIEETPETESEIIVEEEAE